MKKTIIFLLINIIYFFRINAQQISQIEYFFDTDPGFGNATQATITPSANISNLTIPTSIAALSAGVHQFHIRSRDTNGSWSITNRSFFYKIPNVVNSNSNIVALEYFFDNDPGFGNAISVSVSPSTDIANLNIATNIASLSSGVHQLYIRSKDANQNWSITNRSFFYKIPNVVNNNSNIVALEYFFDNDPGFGNATSVSVSPASDIANLNIATNIASLSSGVHQLYIRSKDVNQNWSITNRSFFYKIPNVVNNNSNIVALEYFFDNDPGFGNASSVSVSPATDIANLNIATNIASLSSGVHQLYIRSKDAAGNWSITNRSFFYKIPNAVNNNSYIVALEYFFDNDPGFGNATQLNVPPSSNLSVLNLNIDFTSISLGPHILFVRSKDDEGNWSITNSVPIEKMQPFNITVFLEGYSDNTGSMANVLFNQGIEAIPSNHVDSVLIELHESNYPHSVHSSFTGILKSDGSLIAGAPISALGQSYYIVIKHRNCIETWSANPILITANTNYNFSDSVSMAYGSNQVEIAPNIWALYTGELNADDNIDLLDAALVEADINNFSFGYFASDLNGDGNVDLLDSPILEENLSNFVFANRP